MRKVILTVLVFFFCVNLNAQDKKEEESFGVSFKGFVKTDAMLDTRQTVTAREGHFLLYPQPEENDPNTDDINSTANFNILSIQTRLTSTITAPDAFGAKTSGVVEGAFFGHSNGDINGFRLRHAFLKLDWEKSTLLIGQYWHPMFITEVFPGVVSFNTGVPFQPFSRNPQIRFIQKMQNVELTFVAASQRDFASPGPIGITSTYLRNSVIPILDVNLKKKKKNVVAGAGLNYKALTPKIVTDSGYKTDEKATGISAMAFIKVSRKAFTWKAEGILGQNVTDLLMLGGYGVKAIEAGTEIEEYTPTKTLSLWTDLEFGKEVKLGLFAGYTKNQGADDEFVGNTYVRGGNIESVFRVSPRLKYRMGNAQFAGEVEYTSAAYGTPNNKGEVENTNSVANLRLVFSAFLFF